MTGEAFEPLSAEKSAVALGVTNDEYDRMVLEANAGRIGIKPEDLLQRIQRIENIGI